MRKFIDAERYNCMYEFLWRYLCRNCDSMERGKNHPLLYDHLFEHTAVIDGEIYNVKANNTNEVIGGLLSLTFRIQQNVEI